MTQAGPLSSSYRLESLIAQGGSGQVWRGHDAHGNPRAFKILRPDLAADPTVLRRFIQERDLLASIRHPNVVGVHDLVLDGSRLAIVVDLVDGRDLRAVLTDQGPLPPVRVARIGAHVAGALAAAHALGIVHRDVKPENVLLTGEATDPTHDGEQALLTDFGVAKLIGGSGSTVLVGTPQYLPPESVDGHPPSAAGDLYALGIMLYELLCGLTPFAGRDSLMEMLRAHALEIPGRPEGIPDPLWEVVAALLEKSPQRRPPSAAVVADRLAELADPVSGPLTGEPPAPRLSQPLPTQVQPRSPLAWQELGCAEADPSATPRQPGSTPTPTPGAPPLSRRSALAVVGATLAALTLAGAVTLAVGRNRPATPEPGLTPGAMVSGMPGRSCTPTDRPSGYGSYQRSNCDVLYRYTGSDGATLEPGPSWVVCQRDLGIPNPIYDQGQTNTWWFFTLSDNGQWSWFPQTLLWQGDADQPINGIPLCG